MARKLDAEMTKQLVARVDYYREMGIYDFYRQPVNEAVEQEEPAAIMVGGGPSLFDSPVPMIQDKSAALKAIREDIGDCIRCRLHKGRKNIVFGVGNMNADLMFVCEGPGADEDEQGEPFVGRAGQLQ